MKDRARRKGEILTESEKRLTKRKCDKVNESKEHREARLNLKRAKLSAETKEEKSARLNKMSSLK